MPIWNGTLRTERGTADWLLVSVRALVLVSEIRAAVGMNGTFRTERGTADWLLVAVRALVLGNEIRAAAQLLCSHMRGCKCNLETWSATVPW